MIWSKPHAFRRSIWISRADLSPIGSSGFGTTCVKGRRRAPSPPARITTFIGIVSHANLRAYNGMSSFPDNAYGGFERASTPDVLHPAIAAALLAHTGTPPPPVVRSGQRTVLDYCDMTS